MVTHSSKTWNEGEEEELKKLWTEAQKEELKKLWIKEVGTEEEFDRVVTLGGVAVRTKAKVAKKSKPP